MLTQIFHGALHSKYKVGDNLAHTIIEIMGIVWREYTRLQEFIVGGSITITRLYFVQLCTNPIKKILCQNSDF